MRITKDNNSDLVPDIPGILGIRSSENGIAYAIPSFPFRRVHTTVTRPLVLIQTRICFVQLGGVVVD